MKTGYEELFDSSVALEQNEWTQDALAGIPTCKGVLLFIDSQNNPIQLIQAGSLRRAAGTRVLQQPAEPSRRTDIATLSRKILWMSCHSVFMTQLNYLRLVHTLFTDTAGNWIQLPPPFLATINLDADLPYFNISNNPVVTEKRLVYGLFPNRKAASDFTETLNTVFGLCRNPSLLKTARRASCPYLQMQTCPGPCLDLSLREPYLECVRSAIRCASGHFDAIQKELQDYMRKAVDTLNFEKAEDMKKKLNLLAKLQYTDYQWVHDLREISILHVDQGAKQSVEGKKRKIRTYKWLKITAEGVYDLGDFLPESNDDIDRFLEQSWTTAPAVSYAANIREHLGNLAYFLFRSKPAGFWLDCTEGIAGELLYSGLREQFGMCPLPEEAQKKDTEENSVS